jgi:hypothetical protein
MKLPVEGYSLPTTKVDEEYVVELHAPYDHDGEGAMADTIPNRIDLAAHEFGHVLSGIFESKGGVKNDPRTKGQIGLAEHIFGPSKSQALRIWASELQAWAIAEKISPNLDQVRKARSLETYRKYLDHADRIQRREERRRRRLERFQK